MIAKRMKVGRGRGAGCLPNGGVESDSNRVKVRRGRGGCRWKRWRAFAK